MAVIVGDLMSGWPERWHGKPGDFKSYPGHQPGSPEDIAYRASEEERWSRSFKRSVPMERAGPALREAWAAKEREAAKTVLAIPMGSKPRWVRWILRWLMKP